MSGATANLPARITGGGRLINALRAMAQPSRLMIGVAGAAVIANVMAVAAPGPNEVSGDASSGRLGASLQDSLGKRDRDAAAERRKLEMREQAVRAGETRLAGQLQGQQQAQAAAAAAPGRPGQPGQDQPEVPYDTLAQIYQRMKPQRAAPIFEKLDLEVQTQVARRMRDSVTAQIMSYMSPGSAVELSMALAGRKVIRQRGTPPAPRQASAAPGRTPPSAR
ncbi:MotE family protein [Novosphingobium sp. KA1]|uniref:MotE family protein n=1 Tax=Novosphingobium sp. (strain KA1) TaxID=164608 RepID=UPI001F5E2C86|nr:magnesium transporter [Novosphingobium sp. KA1]